MSNKPETTDKTVESVIDSAGSGDSGDVKRPPVKDITQSRGRKISRVLVMLFAAMAVVVATLAIVKKLQPMLHKPVATSGQTQPSHAPKQSVPDNAQH